MHKKSPPDKKSGARNRRRAAAPATSGTAGRYGNVKSVNDLLSSRSGLARIIDHIPAQRSWAEWLRTQVPAALAGHIVSAVPKTAELVVFADSAAWAMRLRYALAAMQLQILARDATLLRTSVRVQMR